MAKKKEVNKIKTISKNTTNGVGTVEKATYRFSLVALTLAIIILILFLYWFLVPVSVLQIKNNPVPVEKKQIKSGDVQILTIDYCKYENFSGAVNWSLVSNKQVIVLPPYTDTNGIACNDGLKAPIILPPVRFTDTYHLHYSIIYQVSPLRQETVIFNSQPFIIIGSDE